MLYLRAVFLELLLCVHVVGAAVLFRRFFPKESPWLCFVVPILGLLAALNFIEHFVALTNLGWLLPLTLGVSIWAMIRAGPAWEAMRFPTILFVAVFTFTFALKCIAPVVSNATEGVSNLTRVLDYCLGGTLPEVDSFLPPYDYGIYYSFQHYGAAIVKRLFSLDLGTAYNLSYAFLLAWLCSTGAGVAHAITGKRWITLGTLLFLLAAAGGSVIVIMFFGPNGPDYGLAANLNAYWNDPTQNPFSWICMHEATHPNLALEPPAINLYWSEYHASIGGNFITFVAVLASVEVFRPVRTVWPWIGLVAMPMFVIITSAWFSPIVDFLCVGSLGLALLNGRRPENWKFVVIGSAVAIVLLWPSVFSLTGSTSPEKFFWTKPADHTPWWMFLIQWWPVFIPWLFLCFVWKELDLKIQWILVALPILFLLAEFFTYGDRKLTTEKMWAGIYGVASITLLPTLFDRKELVFRFVTGVILLTGLICFVTTVHEYYGGPWQAGGFCNLKGDDWIASDPQKKRLEEVLSRLHAATILPGRSYWDFSQAPAVVDYSENRCFIGYTFHEWHCGRGAEGDFRNQLNNRFYDGTLPDPLTFLNGNNISAVMIWPEDNISDALLAQYEAQLKPDFFYVDCKMGGTSNAGVFFRVAPLQGVPGAPGIDPEDKDFTVQ